jgi:hypothetical protein
MFGFLIGCAEFFAGWWIRGLSSARNLKQINNALVMKNLELTRTQVEVQTQRLQIAILKKEKDLAANSPKPRGRTMTEQIDFQTIEDALHREQRAKAALRAVLKRNNCTEAQIEDVLNSVDNREDGDF